MICIISKSAWLKHNSYKWFNYIFTFPCMVFSRLVYRGYSKRRNKEHGTELVYCVFDIHQYFGVYWSTVIQFIPVLFISHWTCTLWDEVSVSCLLMHCHLSSRQSATIYIFTFLQNKPHGLIFSYSPTKYSLLTRLQTIGSLPYIPGCGA